MKIYKRMSVVFLSLVMIAVLSACQQSSGNSASSSISIENPIKEVTLGMSRAEFASFIGTTESELIDFHKANIELSYEELQMTEPTFLGLDLAKKTTSDEYFPITITFSETGEVSSIMAVVDVEDAEHLESYLTKTFGEPVKFAQVASHVWTDSEETADTEHPQPYVSYMDTGRFTLYVSIGW